MRLRQSIYHSIGLAIAMVFLFLFAINVFGAMETSSRANTPPTLFLIRLALEVGIILSIGIGSLMNLLIPRFNRKSMALVVSVYCLSVIFLPMGIWGAVEMILNHERRRKKRQSPAGPISQPASFSPRLLRWFAGFSWLGAVLGGSLLVLKFFNHPAAVAGLGWQVVPWGAFLISIIFGLMAVWGTRGSPGRGIWVPTLIGIFLSGTLMTATSLPFLFAWQHRILESGKPGLDPAGSTYASPPGPMPAP